MLKGSIYLVNNTVFSNYQPDTSLIYLSSVGYVLIKNSNFYDNKQTFIHAENSTIFLVNVIGNNISCSDEQGYACFGFFFQSILINFNSSFENVSSSNEEIIIYGDKSNFTFDRIYFGSLVTKEGNSVGFLKECYFSIRNTNFVNYYPGLFYFISSFVRFFTINFINSKEIVYILKSNANIFSTIKCDSCESFVFQSKFIDNPNYLKEAGV